MASDISTKATYRQFKIASLCDKLSEADILLGLQHKLIKGCAYIKHDSDFVTQSDIDCSSNSYSEKDKDKPKKAHWHIALEVGKRISPTTVAKWFNVPPVVVEGMIGIGAFKHYLAYLTHISPKAREEGKWEYDPSEVKCLKLPEKAWCAGIKDYWDFKSAYENDLMKDVGSYEKLVLDGVCTPDQVREMAPGYYIDKMDKLDKCYRRYCNSKPTPPFLINYYIHGKGGVGKDLASMLLAISYLQQRHPDIDFTKMTNDDLVRNGYIYYAGNGSSTLIDYKGHEVIIWNDIRAKGIIDTFGSVSSAFRALDTHPKATPINIKYGHCYLKNSINIFNGQQTYDKFIRELSTEVLAKSKGHSEEKAHPEDTFQAKRRFPFFIEVTESFITLNAKLAGLLDERKYNFSFTIENHLRALAENTRIHEEARVFENPYHKPTKALEEKNEKSKIPDEPFKIVASYVGEEASEHFNDAHIFERDKLAREHNRQLLERGLILDEDTIEVEPEPEFKFEDDETMDKMLSGGVLRLED